MFKTRSQLLPGTDSDTETQYTHYSLVEITAKFPRTNVSKRVCCESIQEEHVFYLDCDDTKSLGESTKLRSDSRRIAQYVSVRIGALTDAHIQLQSQKKKLYCLPQTLFKLNCYSNVSSTLIENSLQILLQKYRSKRDKLVHGFWIKRDVNGFQFCMLPPTTGAFDTENRV